MDQLHLMPARSPEQGADLGQVLDRIEIVDQLADCQLGGFPDSADAKCRKLTPGAEACAKTNTTEASSSRRYAPMFLNPCAPGPCAATSR
jgi:hypothetical protein